jgi:hypothetical protein
MKSLPVWYIVALLFLSSYSRAAVGQEPKAEKEFKAVPLAELGVVLVRPEKDPRTGFVVGGKNTTALIRGLKEIHERSIADLEADMRPSKISKKGFLGANENLLDVLAADNDYVLGTLGLTHQELAKPLLVVAAIGKKYVAPKEGEGFAFRYHGRRMRVALEVFRGTVLSPFEDGTRTNSVATIENLDTGKKLKYSLLVPMMVERYGFYEGKGTPYRVDPREIIAVFDFLKKE